MTDQWWVLWLRMIRQIFCWHRLTCAETPDMPQMHFECKKCGWSFTDFEAESDYYRNLAAKWYQKYIEAMEASNASK